MEMTPDEPMFGPEIVLTGAGCSWHIAAPASLSLNDWFIAGPGPGIHRDEWLRAAQDYRARARGGRGRVLLMDGARGPAWMSPNMTLTKSLRLSSGDELYIAFRVRNVEGANALAFAFDYHERDSDSWSGVSAQQGMLEVPDDGEWHELDFSMTIPVMDVMEAWTTPRISLVGAAGGPAGRVEVSGLVLGLADAERMNATGRVLRGLEGARVCSCAYEREDLTWAASAYACHFSFVYDQRFYCREQGYQVEPFLDDMARRFRGVDAIILWPAYPRIGVDERNQFDFFRDMPGGLDALREVIQQFQARGVRVLIPWLPWDRETRREGVSDEEALAALVAAIGADGVLLDTLTSATRALRLAVDEARKGVVLVPELCPPVEQLGWYNISWAQWAQDPEPPGIPLLKWVEPRHMQHFIRRWDKSRREDIETAFFNGTGMLLWENIFGAHNPFSGEDARLWSRGVLLLRAFSEVFSSELWDPFYPALRDELFVHRWPGAPTTLFTLRNMGEPIHHGRLLQWQLPQHIRGDNMRVYDLWHGYEAAWDISEFGFVQVWGDINRLGCFAVTFGEDERIEALLESQHALRNHADLPRAPETLSTVAPLPVAPTAPARETPEGMVFIPQGKSVMRLEHPRRECGCYPDPETRAEEQACFLRGHPPDEILKHDYEVETAAFYIDEAQVTNSEFQRFLNESGYKPVHETNFLAHWPDGVMPPAIADLPVVYIDLDDARAYAAWAGKRLPTEPEWQRAAQGDDERRWPWGDAFKPEYCAPPDNGPMPARALPEGRSPHGCYHMAGNVWEWTESERNDGLTRFCIIRGGSWYNAKGSGWYVTGGPQPLNTHTKFLLMWPGLDRCATIGFRCVVDAAPSQ